MPTYLFRNKDTGEEYEEYMGISACEEYLKANQNIEQLVNGFPGLGHAIIRAKPDRAFRDILKSVKKNNTGISKESQPVIDTY